MLGTAGKIVRCASDAAGLPAETIEQDLMLLGLLVGTIHYGTGIVGSVLVGVFADGTPWPLGWVERWWGGVRVVFRANATRFRHREDRERAFQICPLTGKPQKFLETPS